MSTMSLIRRNMPMWTGLTDFFDDDWTRDLFAREKSPIAVNVVDNETSYEIEIAAPGFNKKDFKIESENGILTISAKTEKEEEEKKKNYTRREFSSQEFSRSFTLPENAMKDNISAVYEDGVLRLMLKKVKAKLPDKKVIAIK